MKSAISRSVLPISISVWKKPVIFMSLALFLAGCASSASVKQVDRLESVTANPKILIMNPDVKYYLLTVGGVPQPQAEWTEAARNNFSTSLNAFAKERGVNAITSNDSDQLTDTEISYQKLYSAVGASILTHHFGNFKLPTKKGSFDWSLGPGIAFLGEKYGADYALFSYYRDYQASGGRTAFAFLAFMVGVFVPAGGEGGFASLVDLRTGDIVWFNRVASGVGELREKDGARAAVDYLLKDLPKK